MFHNLKCFELTYLHSRTIYIVTTLYLPTLSSMYSVVETERFKHRSTYLLVDTLIRATTRELDITIGLLWYPLKMVLH